MLKIFPVDLISKFPCPCILPLRPKLPILVKSLDAFKTVVPEICTIPSTFKLSEINNGAPPTSFCIPPLNLATC